MVMTSCMATVPLPRREEGWRHIWGWSLQGLFEVALLRCAYILERRGRKDIAIKARKIW